MAPPRPICAAPAREVPTVIWQGKTWWARWFFFYTEKDDIPAGKLVDDPVDFTTVADSGRFQIRKSWDALGAPIHEGTTANGDVELGNGFIAIGVPAPDSSLWNPRSIGANALSLTVWPPLVDDPEFGDVSNPQGWLKLGVLQIEVETDASPDPVVSRMLEIDHLLLRPESTRPDFV